jgi:hypothetical protein
MSAADGYLRRKKPRRRGLQEPEPEAQDVAAKFGGLVSQGVRSSGWPRPELTADELIRRGRGGHGGGGWTPIIWTAGGIG